MIPSQMLKGTLEGCILGILSQKETYGYEISSQLAAYGFGTIDRDVPRVEQFTGLPAAVERMGPL